jgi:serine phosphatase RsbU (regulator of sigma subunit)/anti-sigma regulatory factor (Ser/Thr protein kinase)
MPSYHPIHKLKVRLRPDLKEIGPSRQRFLEFLGECHLPPAEIEGWKLVFSELLANAIEHGARQAAEDALLVSWWREANSVHLETKDPGTGPPDEATRDPRLPEDPLSEGGRGLFIVKSFVDSWEHWRGEQGFRFHVWKTYKALPQATPPDPAVELILDELADTYENLALYDQLGQAVIGGTSFADFFQASLQVFIEAGTPDQFHFEPHPEAVFPEFLEMATHPVHGRFGKARPQTWESLATQPYLLWNSESVRPLFQAGGNHWCPEGCAVPIRHNAQTVALIALGHGIVGESLGSRGVRQLQALGNILGLALSRSVMERERIERDRIRHELRIATQLQQKLLPLDGQPPEVPDWSFFIHCQPAQEVAGDFAEIRESEDGTLVGCVIDVMGKGVTAAILAGIFRSHFIAFSRSRLSPGEFLTQVNACLETQLAKQTMFITAVAFRLHPGDGQMELANAGHPPAIILADSGHIREIAALNPPIGLFPNEAYQSIRLHVQPGDRCFLLTDGLFEWTAADGRLFGWERLVRWLGEQTFRPLKLIPKAFYEIPRAPADPQTTHAARDDETLLILAYQPTP